jgi:hypothetical protein
LYCMSARMELSMVFWNFFQKNIPMLYRDKADTRWIRDQ